VQTIFADKAEDKEESSISPPEAVIKLNSYLSLLSIKQNEGM
jgi:hypothetical protein